MLEKTSLQVGINLGGWISQYPALDHNHFKSFLVAEDIKRIADWGFDHVRLPVDYPVLEDTDRPGVCKESGFEYIESCIEWCKQSGLRVVLDLHKTPGFAFDELAKATLFENPTLQERFINLWMAINKRFADRMDDILAFELLNEIVLHDSGPWNSLVKQVVKQIRTLDPKRLIVVGGNQYNAGNELQNLELLDDPNILYTFHFYLPLTLTHQKVPWVPPLVEYNQELNYPGQQDSKLEEIVKKFPKDTHKLDREIGIQFNKEHLRSVLQPAIDFSKRTGQPIYCGEFGVYEGAPMSTRINWTRDFIDLLNESNIGRAIWTYKALDFGLVGKDGKIISQELVDVAAKRKS